jgi:hypothetical protein
LVEWLLRHLPLYCGNVSWTSGISAEEAVQGGWPLGKG